MSKERARIIRRRRVMRNRRIVAICIMALTAINISILFHNFGARAEKPQSNKYYTDVRVERGDTYWDLAMEYMTEEYSSPQQYIREVQQINNLGAQLPYGQIVTVPYYSETEK